VVLEAGAVGDAVRKWGHVRMFSPWRYAIDPAARTRLEAAGWTAPPATREPTGDELVDDYLEPLARLPEIASRLRLGTRVAAITRAGADRVRTDRRVDRPFRLDLVGPDGGEERLLARAVIDASGTWSQPNPAGASGVPAIGETMAAGRVDYGIPDVTGTDRARFAGRRTLVVGAGHSAFNLVLDLARLVAETGSGGVDWAIRRGDDGRMFGGGSADQLPARGRLGANAQALIADGKVSLHTGFLVDRVETTAEGLIVAAEDGRRIAVDRMAVATGFRPDLGMLSELQLDLHPWLECPRALGPLIDPNIHSCGTVRPHGAVELAHPEPGFYIAGMKSYGRAPTFLLATGHEQVRSIAAELAGDHAAAREVRLELPETGVCGVGAKRRVKVAAASTPAPAAACCG
jgi:hypothetical protein